MATRVLLCLSLSLTLLSPAMPQERIGGSFGQAGGGFGGGGFGSGGVAGGARGGSGTGTDRGAANAVQRVEETLASLLGSEFQTHLLTPGEFTEWTVEMKADDVLIAEARSTAFDAGLEIVDAAGKSLAGNDDRYLGDQRPLLLWRSSVAGKFTLRGRSFRDRAGGQYEIRYRVFPSVLIEPGETRKVERPMGTFLLRLPLQRGMIVQPVSDVRKFNSAPAQVTFGSLLSPGGIPGYGQTSLFSDLSTSQMHFAPVDGEYFLVSENDQAGGSEISIHILTPEFLTSGKPSAISAGTNVQLYEVMASKGEILEVSASGQARGYLSAFLPMPELPEPGDESWMDPRKAVVESDKNPGLTPLIARVRDSSRIAALFNRDGRYLVSMSNFQTLNPQFQAQLQSPLRTLIPQQPTIGTLKIGEYHYWAFDAEPGQYVRLELSSQDFAAQMGQISEQGAESNKISPSLDTDSVSRQFLVTAPGRQIVRVSCLGDGGKGDYQLSCTVAPSQDCSLVKPAEGKAESGETRVVRMELEAGVPYLAQFDGPTSGLYFTFADLQGFARNVVMRRKSPERQYALLYSPEKLSLLVVVSGFNKGGVYKVSLSELP